MVVMTATTTPFTLRSASGALNTPPPLTDSALMIIDAQNEYGSEGRLALDGVGCALSRTVALLRHARAAGSPVIHVVHHGAPGGLFDPDDGGRVLDEVAPSAGEIVVVKGLPNAFASTELFERLDELGRLPIVIAGFMTHICVSSTARAALDLGLVTTVVSDATATRSLPDPAGGGAIAAEVIHRSALAALADRFSIVTTTARVLAQ